MRVSITPGGLRRSAPDRRLHVDDPGDTGFQQGITRFTEPQENRLGTNIQRPYFEVQAFIPYLTSRPVVAVETHVHAGNAYLLIQPDEARKLAELLILAANEADNVR